MISHLDVFKKDVGAIGIGTMIVFIAMILVAGIAAAILTQTANKVESRAMQTGIETIGEVAGGLEVCAIEGKVNYSGGTYNGMEYLAIMVEVRPGSSDIDLNQTYILLCNEDKQAMLKYGGYNTAYAPFNTSVDPSGSLFDTGNWKTNYSNEYFGIIVLKDDDGSCQKTGPVINRGDKVVLTIYCGPGGAFGSFIPEGTEITGKVVPEKGLPGVISFVTPSTYTRCIYDLYP